MQRQLELFTERLPHKPYCTDDLNAGLRIRNQEHATRARYIQHNPPAFVTWLVFDIDRKASADDWIAANLPPPAWVTINPKNGHSHIVYGLSTPVTRTEAAHLKPLRFCAAVEAGYRNALRADPGYVGLVTKNPLNKSWRVWIPPSSNDGLYELAELAEYVDLPTAKAKKTVEDRGIGRNVSLFDAVRHWSYLEIRKHWRPGGADKWYSIVALETVKLNDTLFGQDNRLSYGELKGIARSIAKWTWKNMTPDGLQDLIDRTHTPAIQSERGKKGGRPSLGAPWEDEGISRRTWFRRRSGEA